ncbi:TPA: single-stranded DNA-binding protein [Streptococcus suis]|uniref:single-stranded DNA-binding protein n=1 Tax=Streptococcus suis TaxID=1307 RepID=UPI002A76B3B1|nr:single-stranded DNA-binding protein [Streptococcus suis]
MINNVVLVGRLTRDAELRYTPSNVAVATFTLAVNRPFKNENGEREADFINCVIWRQAAENLANWAKKGALIGITGNIQTRHYDNQQGQRVYVTEVIASNFQLLESRNNQSGQQNQSNSFQNGNNSNSGNFQSGNNQGGYQSPFGNQSTPDFSRSNQQSFFQGQTTNPMDISDDDLPF